MISSATTEWLITSAPWLEYRVRCDLFGEKERSVAVQKARELMIRDTGLQAILQNLMDWPGVVLSSHRSASQSYHKLSMLADLGFRSTDPPLTEIAGKMLAHLSEEGIVQLPMQIAKAYGGSGEETGAWALCDAPINLYILVKLYSTAKPAVQKGIAHLTGLLRANGWPCAVSKELGKWRGPGKKDDPCPYATLVMLKLLSACTEHADSEAVRTGIDTLCRLWEDSMTQHPYMFYMGTDFRKLKAPLVWYDIVHVLDVLSCFPYARKKTQVKEMLQLVTARQTSEGKYVPESVWTEWKGWDFAQKKNPSTLLTFLIYRIQKQLDV